MSDAPQSEQLLGLSLLLKSAGMREVLALAERVAHSSAPVMITGETGSGKEMVARAIHHYSMRCNRPWVDINCAALPEHLVESELFGHEKGAFSGADSAKPGFFEMASTGTLFLDEIGELDPRTQVKLLRVLDGVPYYRLGGTKKITVDTRVVAATSRDLAAEVENGRFRRDLYYRIAAAQLHVPPLRQRTDDIIPLAEFFLANGHPGITINDEAAAVLSTYAWPGNVRELRNVVTYAALFTRTGVITPHDLPAHFQSVVGSKSAFAAAAGATVTSGSAEPALEDLERQAIINTLSKTQGHRQEAARILGISRRTLSRKLKSYGHRSASQ